MSAVRDEGQYLSLAVDWTHATEGEIYADIQRGIDALASGATDPYRGRLRFSDGDGFASVTTIYIDEQRIDNLFGRHIIPGPKPSHKRTPLDRAQQGRAARLAMIERARK